MDADRQEAFEAFQAAYGTPPRPTAYGNPHHCQECAEANRLLLDRYPEELDPAELNEPSKGWFFAYAGEAGWRYFLPGLVRLALSEPTQNLRLLLTAIQPALVASLGHAQREALQNALGSVLFRRAALDSCTRRLLRKSQIMLATPTPDQTAHDPST